MRNTPKWKEVIAEVGMEEPIPKDPHGTIESIIADSEFMTKDSEFTKDLQKPTHIKKFMKTRLQVTHSIQEYRKSLLHRIS